MANALKKALGGTFAAGVGLVAVLMFLLYIVFYIALAVLVIGGAYLLLQYFGLLMVGVPL